ncbi:MAG TPA: DEAD/DEAH box helicase [Candidatus Dormibacteraeota bacterium]|nr:DEAD/DEAH box helicase [Candidatus Dormibacteraeota bacterium]
MTSSARQTVLPEAPASTWSDILGDPELKARIVLDQVIPAREPTYGPLPADLDQRVRQGLQRHGIGALYTHQVEAIELAMAGQSVAVVTPTASGKSLCYLIPVLDAMAKSPESTAILIYPTKALAQDQLAEIHQLSDAAELELRTFTYDGDTPSGARSALRQAGQIVLTNPDMLHSGILPHHTHWARLFKGLRYVVLDELHTYRGVFGSHVANVIRRLDRICAFYGARPTYICCSATIANPQELAQRLLGRGVELVDRNGAPAPSRRVVVINPPIVEPRLGIRRSAAREATALVPQLVRTGSQTIVFAQTRLQVELLLSHLRQELDRPGVLSQTLAEAQVRAYRGGYLPLERRAIEAGLRSGDVRCVVSTSALELGIDIGRLDAAVLVGYPGTITSTWQRLGRAGRRNEPALQVLITGGGPLDQYLAKHPAFLLERSPEHAFVDPDNLLILAGHLQAAVFELPFRDGETFGPEVAVELLEILQEDGLVHHTGGSWHWAADAFPADAISLRTAAASNVVILDTSVDGQAPSQGPQGPFSGSSGGHSGSGARVVGELDEWSAPLLVHDDAIYLHQGRQYHVERLDWEERRAYVHPVSVDYYTDADLREGLQVLERMAGPLVDEGRRTTRSHGEVRVSVLAAMYRKIRLFTNETVGSGPIRVPERDLQTTAYWCTFPAPVPVLEGTLEVGLESVGHVLGQVACFLAMCDRRDLGVVAQVRASVGSITSHPQAPEPGEFFPGDRPSVQPAGPLLASASESADAPSVFIYDVHPAGVGLSSRLFDLHPQLLVAAVALLRDCECDSGCPACVGPVAGIEPHAKATALALLGACGW